jgi:hypothetical protein
MNNRDIEHMWKVANNNPNHDTNWHDPAVIAFAHLVEAAARDDERDRACAYMRQMHDAYSIASYPPRGTT